MRRPRAGTVIVAVSMLTLGAFVGHSVELRGQNTSSTCVVPSALGAFKGGGISFPNGAPALIFENAAGDIVLVNWRECKNTVAVRRQ